MAPWTLKITGCGSPGNQAIRKGPTFRSMRAFETYTTSAMAASCVGQVDTNAGVLFVPNFLWSPLPVERQNLQLPMHGNRSWKITNLFVASLVVQLSVDRKCFSVRPKGRAKIRCGAYF